MGSAACLTTRGENVDIFHWRIQGWPWGPPPCHQVFFQNHAAFRQFKGKTPILSKFWAQGPLGSKLHWAPLTKILDSPRIFWSSLPDHFPWITARMACYCCDMCERQRQHVFCIFAFVVGYFLQLHCANRGCGWAFPSFLCN